MTTKILDDHQKTAIYWPLTRSVIIMAPPGHGKTFVMARRIEYVLQTGFVKPPHKILGLTFTNSAAGEMMDDIRAQLSSEQQSLVQVMTFHSFCYKVLRAYGNTIGLERNFTILSELQQQRLLKSIFSEILKVQSGHDVIKEYINAYQDLVKERHLKMNADYTHPLWQPILEQAIIKYEKKLGSNQVDYTGLLEKTAELFETKPEILEWYRSTFRYFLVDEFQDTNPRQLKLLSLLVNGFSCNSASLPEAHVYILTDPYQAIFRFQGATPDNIGTVKKEFKCGELSLHKNYRSSNPSIIALTNRMRKNPDGPSCETIEKIPLFVSESPHDQAQRILEIIKKYPGDLHDICILAQSSYGFDEIKAALKEQAIPFVFIPDFKAKSVELRYGEVFDLISQMVVESNSDGKLTVRIQNILADHYPDWQKDDVLNALFDLAIKFERSTTGNNSNEITRQFYNDIFLEISWGNLLRKRVRNKVFLSTIHGAKGLQFPQVHLTGLVNFEHIHSSICFPCGGSMGLEKRITDLKEPFSTLYVGVSRAQEELYLYAVRKNCKGKKRNPVCILSCLRDVVNIPQGITICGSN